MLTLPIPLPDPCRNVAPAIAPPTVRQDCDQLQANESRLPLSVIHDRVEPTTGLAMSAMLRITPRGPLCPYTAQQSSNRHPPTAFAAPWPHPMARSTRALGRRRQGHPGIGFGRIGRPIARLKVV